MRAFGWAVLGLVFVDELACMTAFGMWGWAVGGPVRWLLVVAAPIAAMTAWYLFASPKAPHGGSWRRPLAKLVVFGLAALALWHTGHGGWAIALLVFSVVINALAQLPSISALAQPAP